MSRLIATVLICTTTLAGCGGTDDHDHPHLVDGEQLYDHHCARCHRGQGDGTFMLGVPPVRYTTLSYRELVDRIRGHARPPGSRMPAFSRMPKTEAEAIAIYLRRKLAAG